MTLPFAPTGQITQSLIPSELRANWRRNEEERQRTKLDDYLELRDWIEENAVMLKSSEMTMQAYAEAAEDFRVTSDAVRRNLRIIREYPDTLLRSWFANGFGFSHIEAANTHADEKRSPADLLAQALHYGAPEGDRPMTVDELEQFATGDKQKWSLPKVVTNLFSRLQNLKVVQGWDDDKRKRFADRLDEIKREFFT